MLSSATGDKNYDLINAYRLERVQSNLRFLRECRRRHVIPNGFKTTNKISSTINSSSYKASQLALQHSKQWMNLAINELYAKRAELQANRVQHLPAHDNSSLDHYRYLLRAGKRKKMSDILSKAQSTQNATNSAIRQPAPAMTHVGFVNKSSATFSETEIALLNKGPSYVPPPPLKVSLSARLHHAAELQACSDRVLNRNRTLAASSEFTEFLSGTHRITNCAFNRPSIKHCESRHIQQTIKSIKEKSIPIMPTDKTKRLISLDADNYAGLLNAALNTDDKQIRSVLPTSRQQHFNGTISDIAKSYTGSKTYYILSKCKVSEPLPSTPYVLPKDHKSGPLKGRPIIASCDSAVRPVATLIAKVLNPLVPLYVPAHLQSTTQFIDIISNNSYNGDYQFGSLDVINLYGSIPLEDDMANNAKGIITVVTDFFETHHIGTPIEDMTPADFGKLLRLCLYGDVYVNNSSLWSQSSGIAMGNCAAPPLAIIYMDYIERQILSLCPAVCMWVRYIDDIFFVARMEAEDLLQHANTVNPYIQFTLEKPKDGELPFLDTSVRFNDNIVSTKLFIKPMHSGTCMPFDSYVPAARKKCLIISENIRATRNSSELNKQSSRQMVNDRLQANGYPISVISKTVNSIYATPKESIEPVTFIKIPFRSEAQRAQILQLARSTEMDTKLRIIFTTEPPLSRQFRPQPPSQNCPAGCFSCLTAKYKNNCFRKHVVYKISCLICNAVYIGQTGRTIRSRILEHGKSPDSHVRSHMQTHDNTSIGITNISTNDNKCSPQWSFTWQIVTSHRWKNTRMALEAMHIQQNRQHLMNGCEGACVLPYLRMPAK